MKGSISSASLPFQPSGRFVVTLLLIGLAPLLPTATSNGSQYQQSSAAFGAFSSLRSPTKIPEPSHPVLIPSLQTQRCSNGVHVFQDCDAQKGRQPSETGEASSSPLFRGPAPDLQRHCKIEEGKQQFIKRKCSAIALALMVFGSQSLGPSVPAAHASTPATPTSTVVEPELPQFLSPSRTTEYSATIHSLSEKDETTAITTETKRSTTESSSSSDRRHSSSNPYQIKTKNQFSAAFFLTLTALGTTNVISLLGETSTLTPHEKRLKRMEAEERRRQKQRERGVQRRNRILNKYKVPTPLPEVSRQPTKPKRPLSKQEQQRRLMEQVTDQVHERYRLRTEALNRKREEHRKVEGKRLRQKKLQTEAEKLQRKEELLQEEERIRQEYLQEEAENLKRKEWILEKQSPMLDTKVEQVNTLTSESAAAAAAAAKKKEEIDATLTDNSHMGRHNNTTNKINNNGDGLGPSPTGYVGKPLEVVEIIEPIIAPIATTKLSKDKNKENADATRPNTDDSNMASRKGKDQALFHRNLLQHRLTLGNQKATDTSEERASANAEENDDDDESIEPGRKTVDMIRGLYSKGDGHDLPTDSYCLKGVSSRGFQSNVKTLEQVIQHERNQRNLLKAYLDIETRRRKTAKVKKWRQKVAEARLMIEARQKENQKENKYDLLKEMFVNGELDRTRQNERQSDSNLLDDRPPEPNITSTRNDHSEKTHQQVLQQEIDQRELLKAHLAIQAKATACRKATEKEKWQRKLLDAHFVYDSKKKAGLKESKFDLLKKRLVDGRLENYVSKEEQASGKALDGQLVPEANTNKEILSLVEPETTDINAMKELQSSTTQKHELLARKLLQFRLDLERKKRSAMPESNAVAASSLDKCVDKQELFARKLLKARLDMEAKARFEQLVLQTKMLDDASGDGDSDIDKALRDAVDAAKEYVKASRSFQESLQESLLDFKHDFQEDFEAFSSLASSDLFKDEMLQSPASGLADIVNVQYTSQELRSAAVQYDLDLSELEQFMNETNCLQISDSSGLSHMSPNSSAANAHLVECPSTGAREPAELHEALQSVDPKKIDQGRSQPFAPPTTLSSNEKEGPRVLDNQQSGGVAVTRDMSSFIPVNDKNVEFTSGLLGAILGFFIGGPLFGVAGASVANYVSRDYERNEDVHKLARATVGTALGSINLAAAVLSTLAESPRVDSLSATSKKMESPWGNGVREAWENALIVMDVAGDLNHDLVEYFRSLPKVTSRLAENRSSSAVEMWRQAAHEGQH